MKLNKLDKKILKDNSKQKKASQQLNNPINQYAQQNDLEDLILNHYKNFKNFGKDEFHSQIENWLFSYTEQSLKPLILKTKKDEDLQPFLVEWIFKHISESEKHFQDVIIPNFVNYANKESSQYVLIYDIILKIREIFNIQQSIEPSQEKLRINFFYWLDLASRKIQQNKFFDGDLIIIIDGAHLIMEKNQNVENNFKFWIPEQLPQRVKLIITLNENSYNLKYFQKNNCQIINFYSNIQNLEKNLDFYRQKKHFLNQKDFDYFFEIIKDKISKGQIVNFFVQIYFDSLLCFYDKDQCDINQKNLEKIRNIFQNRQNIQFLRDQILQVNDSENLIKLILNFYENQIVPKQQFIDVFSLLSQTYQGLKLQEIINISDLDINQLQILKFIFNNLILNHQDYYKITNSIFIKSFQQNYSISKKQNQSINKKIFLELESQKDSIRKLEEQTNNLYRAKDFFNLKQQISQIENFLILYSQKSKYDLFKFWKKLEAKGYDPVFEYNKSYELFEMHYNPKDQDIFMINIQLCRFFKELSNFESSLTPNFRHPFIKDKIIQNIKDIRKTFGKNKSQKKNQISFDSKYFIKEEKNILNIFYQDYPVVFKSEQNKYEQAMSIIDYEDPEEQLAVINYLAEIGIQQELIRLKICGGQSQILKEHEKININIPLNLEKFLNFFKGLISQKYQYLNKMKSDKSLYDFEIEEEDSQNQESNFFLLKEKKDPMENLNQNIRLIDLTIEPEKPRKYYYYKRWIWMNFPIICLFKDKNEFSNLIFYCYHDSKSFLSYQQERNLYLKSLDVIYNCKQKKDLTIKKKLEKQQSSINQTKYKYNDDGSKMYKSQIQQQSSQKDKLNFNIKSNNNKKNNFQKILKKSSSQNSKQQMPAIKSFQMKRQFSKTSFRNSQYLNIDDKRQKKISLITVPDSDSQDVIRKILRKSEMFEGSVMKKNIKDLSKSVFNIQNIKQQKNLCQQKTDKLNKHFNHYNDKQTMVVINKKEQIIKELNKVNHEILDLKKMISKLETKKLENNQNQKKELQESDGLLQIQNQEIVDFNQKIKQMKKKFFEVLDQKNRYQAIIDICHINQIQNEDWIRNLNFYLSNLKKVCQDQRDQIVSKRIQKKNKKLESQLILKDYQTQTQKYKILINNFKKYLKQKLIIDKTLLETDNLILDNLKQKNELDNSIVQNRNFKQKKQTIKSQDQQVQERSNNLKQFFEQFSNLFFSEQFQDKENFFEEKLNKNWNKSQQFQNLLFQLQIHKQIEQSNYELQLQVIDEEKRKENLQRKLQILKERNCQTSQITPNNKENNKKQKFNIQNYQKKTQQIYELRNYLSLGLENILNQLKINRSIKNNFEELESQLKKKIEKQKTQTD